MNDATDQFNGYTAEAKQFNQDAYRTVEFAQTPDSPVLVCGFGSNNQLHCTDTIGDTVFEVCDGYLRFTDNAIGDAGCFVVTLTAIDPATT